MKFKSTLALLLAMIMVVAALTGCGGSKEPTTTDPTTTAPTTQPTETTEPTPEAKKEIEISIALWDFVEWGNDPISQKISDDLKVKLVPKTLSWENDLEQIKLFGATGMMPDLIASYTVDYDITRFYGWIDQGLLRDIPADMVEKYPTVKSIFENDAVLNAVKPLKDNKYWFIPRPSSIKGYYKASHNVFYYRKDWLANVGITKTPETMEEFYQMLRAFTLNDPDQNGKKDTFGLTMAKLNTIPFAIWGATPGYWVEEDGKWIPGYFSKKNIEPLKYLRRLYQEGLLDPEFTKNNHNQAIQKLTTNTFGVLLRNGDLHWLNRTIVRNWHAANPEVEDPLTVIGVLPPLKKDESSQPQWPMFVEACGTEVSSKVDDEKLDRILEMFEYLLKPETKELLQYGIEGEDYTREGDKIIQKIDPETNAPISIINKYPSVPGFGNLTDWGWDNDIENPLVNISPEMKELGKWVRDTFNPIAMKINLSVGYISTPTKDITQIQSSDAFTQIVIGTEDVEAMFDRFVKESMEKGMATAIDEVNAEVQRLGIK